MKKITILCLMFFTIINIYSQDYLIDFAGTGSSTTIDIVKIENLSQGTYLTINGSDILNLKSVLTDIDLFIENPDKSFRIYPNPVSNYCIMEFFATSSENTEIAIYDPLGKIVTQTKIDLQQGRHTFQINGLGCGVYFVKLISDKYSCTGTILSQYQGSSLTNIIYEGSISNAEFEDKLKSSNSLIPMQYNLGERLKITGTSGNFNTVITDIPDGNKTITFDFIGCSDYDNNHYPIVKIGSQTWMAENLKTTKYNDGTPISLVTDNTEWDALTTPAYCWFNNDQVTYGNTYGALYNWYTVETGNLCPNGWHVPTDDEWTILENYLIANGYNYDGTTEGDRDSNNKIAKALASATGWNSTTGKGVVGHTDYPAKRNATGFTALPGGYRSGNGTYSRVGNHGNWWSATEDFTGYAWTRGMYHSTSYVFRSNDPEELGVSVRCLSDN